MVDPHVAPPHEGWHLLALGRELTEPVSSITLGDRPLLVIRDEEATRVFDGTCPHRGANLGVGGKLIDQRAIICPFHGRRIALGSGAGHLRVCEHEVLDAGGALFVKLAGGADRDHGLRVALKEIMSTHDITGAVIGEVKVPPELIIENAFDIDHFSPVHLIARLATPKVSLGPDGELSISTAFRTRAPAWEDASGDFTSRFHARSFRPSLVVTELGPPESSNIVITGATAVPGGCVARIAVGIRRPAAPATVTALVDGAQHAFDQDLRVWQHLNLAAKSTLDSRDAPVRAFRAFCAGFAPPAAA
jgi:nitrite reductase/ring-hydroxylating ferredoxin subunit